MLTGRIQSHAKADHYIFVASIHHRSALKPGFEFRRGVFGRPNVIEGNEEDSLGCKF